MRQVVRLGQRAAQSNIPILIEGESGVGKELIARAIQGCSERAGKPFVTVNCGAIPENLVESILFGHEKGAFTGASDKHLGKFQEADGGTLFLDEIGELRLDMQVKLLRALQEGEIDPVGAKRPVKVDVRIISATNRDLAELTHQGQFREDLFYRLNVFPMFIPPLRERHEDIPALAKYFVARFAAEENKQVAGFTPEALALLDSYAWPGNVRQLENTIFRAVVLCDADALDVVDFPQIASAMGVVAHERKITNVMAPPGTARNNAPMPTRAAPTYGISGTDTSGHMRKLEEIEAEIIRMAIARYDGRMSEIARRLGIGRSTLYRKLKELGLDHGHDLPEPTKANSRKTNARRRSWSRWRLEQARQMTCPVHDTHDFDSSVGFAIQNEIISYDEIAQTRRQIPTHRTKARVSRESRAYRVDPIDKLVGSTRIVFGDVAPDFD